MQPSMTVERRVIAYESQIRETIFSGEFYKPPNNSRSAQVGFLRKCIFQPPTEQKKVAQLVYFPQDGTGVLGNNTR